MSRPIARVGRRVGASAVVVVLAAGCASANKTSSMASSGTTGGGQTASGSGSMPGMSMGGSSVSPAMAANMNAKGISVGGLHPIPTQLLASTEWQGMRIEAYATTAVPFLVYTGTSMQIVKPAKQTSFHLMVSLTDASTGVAIPYSTVWATIKRAGKVVYDERQYPMISRYMGPHYGNDVTVPGSGTYQLSLVVSPPVSARHIEYQNVWMAPHQADFTFHWKQPAGM